MKIVKVNVPTGESSGGYVGVPQERHWMEDWKEDQSRWVMLSCGHIEDITSRSITLINSFKGSTVHCDRCSLFASVIRVVKTKTPPVIQPELPPF